MEPLKIQEPVNFKTAEGFGAGYPGPRSPTQQEYAQSEMRGNGSTAGITCPAIRMRYPTSCHCCIVGMRSQAGQGFTWKRGTEQAHSTQPSAQFCHCNPDFVLICVTSFLLGLSDQPVSQLDRDTRKGLSFGGSLKQPERHILVLKLFG